MKVKFETVLNGINRYINDEIYKNLNDLQEVLARFAIGRINAGSENIKAFLINNGFAMTFGIIDGDGMVDIDGLLGDLRNEIERKGKIEFTVPMIGKMKFTAADIDQLRSYIVRE